MKALLSPCGGLGSNARERMAPVSWQSVAGVDYFLERSADLASLPIFTPLATGLPGQPGTTSYTDMTATNAGPYFYLVGVGN